MNQKFRQNLTLSGVTALTALTIFSLRLQPTSFNQPQPVIKYPLIHQPLENNYAPPSSNQLPNPGPESNAPVIPASASPLVPTNETASHPNYPYTALIDNNNPLYPTEPFTSRINAATGISTISNSNTNAPVIAVIDTGFALNHVNLASRWNTDPAEMGPTSIGSSQNCLNQGTSLDKRCNNYDNNSDGYPSNWRGWDFINNDNDPSAGTTSPTSGTATHGTLTASLAAVLNPNAKIMPLQALDDTGSGYTDTVAAAIRYAADHGADIISLSLGSTYDDAYLRSQITYAINKGVVIVAAAGNNGCDCLSYPAAYPEVLSVGAVDATDNRAYFSSYGSNLDVVAPGTSNDVCGAIWSTASSTSYSCSYSGTSFATPIVASLVSLIITQAPDTTVSDAIRFITQNADKTSAMSGQDRTNQYGYGRINVYKSLAASSLATPNGQLLNKHLASLSSNDLTIGPLMNSTCQGNPGASCDIRLTSPDNSRVVYLGAQTLDAYGSANFAWNAASLNLTPGTWKIESVMTYQGQTTVKPSLNITINP